MNMKKPLLLMLTAGILWPAQAQWFGPEAFTGAALGGVIGGVTGGHTYRHRGHYHRSFSGEGAAIGAGIGWLAGALMGEARRRDDYYAAGSVYVPAATANIGYGYTEGGHAGYVYYAPNAYCAPGWYYRPARPNYTLGGALLGAASGALIGAGTGDAGAGAAIGAGAGLVLGGVAEHAARRQEQRNATPVSSPPATQQPPAPPTAPPPVVQNPATSRPAPNSTYYWTPRPQIADAPAVPDAPTF